VLTNIVIPLCKPGIAIGSIFVVTLVMGDYITVRMMGGGLRASVGVMMWNEISLLLYPPAAANAVVLLVIVLILVSLMMRVVDLKKEL
jgi:putative spermidine/putrescine transport system permease protein